MVSSTVPNVSPCIPRNNTGEYIREEVTVWHLINGADGTSSPISSTHFYREKTGEQVRPTVNSSIFLSQTDHYNMPRHKQ